MGERHLCEDCGVDTWDIGELYMVWNEVWDAAAGPVWLIYDSEGVCIDRVGPGMIMLCVGCLEARLGRELTPDDFTDAPINKGWRNDSARLQHRLRGTQS